MMHSNVQKPDPNEYVDTNGVRWRLIPGTTRYYAGSNGEIKSFAAHKDGIILVPSLLNSGYHRVKITDWKRPAEVHRLVALAFIANPDNLPQVNHIDGNKLNNSVENLEWCDYEYNVAHALEHNLYHPKIGEESGNAVLTNDIVRKIYIEYYINHTPISTIAETCNINMSTVRSVIYKHSWIHVTDALDIQYGIVPKQKDVVYMTEEEVKEIYLLHRLRNLTADEIQKDFPHLGVKAIQGVIYKETWTKITDKMDTEYKFPEKKTVTPLDKELVKSIYMDLRVNGFTAKDVQQKYKLSNGTVTNILYKNRWKEYTDELDKEYDIPPYTGKQNPKLDKATVIECYKLMKAGHTSRQVSNMKNISNDVLRKIWKKKSWKKTTDMVDLKMDYKL